MIFFVLSELMTIMTITHSTYILRLVQKWLSLLISLAGSSGVRWWMMFQTIIPPLHARFGMIDSSLYFNIYTHDII